MSEPEKISILFTKLVGTTIDTFPLKGKPQASNKKGVYIIYNQDNIPLHVGTTPRGNNGINQRLYNHLTGSSSFSKNYLKKHGINLRVNYTFKFIEIDNDARTRRLLEHYTIGKICPKHLGTSE